MIQRARIGQVLYAAERSCLAIVGAEDDARDARLGDRAHAHDAGFERDVSRHAPYRFGSRVQRRDLGMLAAGELIGVYEGPQVEEDGTYVLWVEDEPGGGWTGYDGRNDMRFLNHSPAPNAEMDGLYCYALENIPAGREITIDYGWEDS